MVLMEFSVVPLDKGASVAEYVARAVTLIDASGLDYELHAMGTIVEGPLPEVLDLLRRCLETLAVDCDRVTCTAKLDYRRGAQGRLRSKVARVESIVGRPLRTGS